MIIWKTEQLKKELAKCPSDLRLMVYILEYLAQKYFKKDIVITSIYRPDDLTSVHAYYRGIDVRVFYQERGDSEMQEWFTEKEAIQLVANLTYYFDYGDGAHLVAILHGEPKHIHLQVAENKSITVIRNWNK